MITLLPVTNQTNTLATEIKAGIVICAMQKLALKHVQTWNGWPLVVVQDTRGIDEDIASTRKGRTVWVSYCHRPFCLAIVPHCAYNLMVDTNILVQVVL